MQLTINSRKFKRDIIFTRPGSWYVWVNINNGNKTDGQQLCHGGGFIGSTISYHGNDQEEFNRICRNWWTLYLKNDRTVNS